jgi:uncharacterized damage-inducible protein DinB
MGAKGYELADAFDQATDRLVDTIRTLSDEQWTARRSDDAWTVAQEALHLGVWMEVEGDWIARLAAGKPTLPLSREAADRLNARLMADFPTPTREQTLLAIAGNRTLVRHFLIGLSDEQLARSVPTSSAFLSGSNDVSITIGDLARRMLVQHVESHLSAIQETVGATL